MEIIKTTTHHKPQNITEVIERMAKEIANAWEANTPRSRWRAIHLYHKTINNFYYDQPDLLKEIIHRNSSEEFLKMYNNLKSRYGLFLGESFDLKAYYENKQEERKDLSFEMYYIRKQIKTTTQLPVSASFFKHIIKLNQIVEEKYQWLYLNIKEYKAYDLTPQQYRELKAIHHITSNHIEFNLRNVMRSIPKLKRNETFQNLLKKLSKIDRLLQSNPDISSQDILDSAYIETQREQIIKKPHYRELICDKMTTLTSEKVKRAAFGETCNTNLKVVAREGDKPTLDNTCQHTYDLEELQAISVLVKALQKNNNKIDTIRFLTVEDLKSYEKGPRAFIECYIAPPFSTSCHRHTKMFNKTPYVLFENDFEALYFEIGKFRFRLYAYIFNGVVSFSDTWVFTESKQCVAQSSVLTQVLLKSLIFLNHELSDSGIKIKTKDSLHINPFYSSVRFNKQETSLRTINVNKLNLIEYPC